MEVVEDIVEEWFFRRPLPFLPYSHRRKVHATLESLLNQGIKLGAFSDYPPAEKLEALGLSQYFSFALSAWDEEMSGFKPHTNGFNIAAERMNLYPAEILYVGDRAKVDGTGAHLAGMSCVIIGNKKLKEQDGTFFIKYFSDLQMLL
jgi:FMN phosphatase YigB (HAD superfamily)